MNFAALVQSIADIHRHTHATATRAVNVALTLRNWLIGAYIHEYELQGQDRAEYGERLMQRLADALRQQGVPSCERPRLYAYLTFYRVYPQVAEAVPQEWAVTGDQALASMAIVRSVTGQSTSAEGAETIVQSATGIAPAAGRMLVERLSYTHLELLVAIDVPLKRAFYEVECMRGTWSVRELKRQIASLYFERSGLSRDKARLAELAHSTAEQTDPRLAIRDPYVFEFLGLRPRDVLPEADLEAALLAKLEAFLLELGHGFCFEARQKRLLIGGEAFFVDLVFYHRVLKCHVLVELKVDEFRHEHLAQLNTYVSYYRVQEMTAGDQPPVGILLCIGKNYALVEYALAGMDNRLFVSKYQLELPKPEELQRYIDEQRRLLEAGEA